MLAHLGTRTLAGAVVVAGVVSLTFLLMRLAPGDPVARLLGPTATPAQLAIQRRVLGLDRPLAAQYAIWLGRFVRGDWGRSIATGRPVRALLGDAVPATLALVGTALGLTYLGGDRVVSHYGGGMSTAKAALQIDAKQLASNLGPKKIRVNLISAGPYASRAARAIGCMFTLAKQNSRIKRLYVYQFNGAPKGFSFDAGIVNVDGTARPSWTVVKQRKARACRK